MARLGSRRIAIAAALAGAVPLAGMLLYFGSREAPGPGAAQEAPPLMRAARSPVPRDAREAHDVGEAITGLAERLRQAPDDPDGWAMLARSYGQVGQREAAEAAERRAAALRDYGPGGFARIAEDLIVAAKGEVGAEARALLEDSLRIQPDDPRARFYLGLAHAQSREDDTALRLWLELEADAPADAQWLPGLRDQIAALADDAKVDAAALAKRRAEAADRSRRAPPVPPPAAPAAAPPQPAAAPPQAPRGPGSADIAAAAQLPPEQRQAMIRSMVEGLASRLEGQPDDLEGWQRIARAYAVLGETVKARDAYRRVAYLSPREIELLRDYAKAIVAAGGGVDDAEFATVMRSILSLAPDDADALWNVGLIEARAGKAERAIELWSRLRERLPSDSPDRAELGRRIEQLRRGG